MKGFLENGLAEADSTLEVGDDNGFKLIDDAQPSFRFGDDSLLLFRQVDSHCLIVADYTVADDNLCRSPLSL